jgi:signal transduction histidine kinase
MVDAGVRSPPIDPPTGRLIDRLIGPMIGPMIGRLRPPTADIGLATVVGLVVLAGTAITARGRWADPSWWVVATAPVLLAWSRRRPVTVAVALLLICGFYYPLSRLDGPILITFVVALFSVAASGRLVAGVVVAAVAVAGAGYGESVSVTHPLGDVGVFLMAGWLTAVLALGALQQGRQAYRQVVRERAAATERARADEQRLRIAQEVHDVVGHGLSLIQIQASAALYRMGTDPGQAAGALAVIKTASRDALLDLRGALESLRTGDGAGCPRPSGIAALPALVATARVPAGPRIELELVGPARPLPEPVDRLGYRIVQEALTNVRRHAVDVRTIRITLEYHADAIDLVVDDDGRPRPAAADPVEPGREPGHGHGLAGLRQRAETLGGTLHPGPRPDRGYRVAARLPARECELLVGPVGDPVGPRGDPVGPRGDPVGGRGDPVGGRP